MSPQGNIGGTTGGPYLMVIARLQLICLSDRDAVCWNSQGMTRGRDAIYYESVKIKLVVEWSMRGNGH